MANEIELTGMTDDEYLSCLKDVIKKKNGELDIEWVELVDKYNIPFSVETFRKACNTAFGGAAVADFFLSDRHLEKDFSNKEELKTNIRSTISMGKDGKFSSVKLLEMTQEQSRDIEYVLNVHGFDPASWEVVSFRNSARQTTRNDDVKTLYSSSILVKPKITTDTPLSKIDSFFDKMNKKESSKFDNVLKHKDCNKNLLLIDIADLHYNLLSSVFTCGENYNCEIAESLFSYVIQNIMNRVSKENITEIIFTIGGDMLNAEFTGTTTKGTAQDNEKGYYDAFEDLCEIVIKAIDYLRKFCKVNVIYVMGNHDEVAGYKLARIVSTWFKNDENVVVDYAPQQRKYFVYGKTLLCFAHNGDVKRLPVIIADEARSMWSEVESVEVFLQHLHTEQVLFEEHNIRIQRLPTISGISKWSHSNGYGSKRQCKSFIFNHDSGLTDILYTPITKSIFDVIKDGGYSG